MAKNLRANLVSNYDGWGTAVYSSTIFHRIALLQNTGMNIDTYGDQNNIKYPNKIKLIKLAVERMKRDNFLYTLRDKNVHECTFLSLKVRAVDR